MSWSSYHDWHDDVCDDDRWAEWVWLLLDHIQRQQAVICCLNTISSWFKLSGDNSRGHTAIVNEKYLLSTGLPYHHMVHSCRVRLTAFSSLTTLDLDTDSIFIRSIASQLTSGWPWISGWWGGWREGDGRLHTIAVRWMWCHSSLASTHSCRADDLKSFTPLVMGPCHFLFDGK